MNVIFTIIINIAVIVISYIVKCIKLIASKSRVDGIEYLKDPPVEFFNSSFELCFAAFGMLASGAISSWSRDGAVPLNIFIGSLIAVFFIFVSVLLSVLAPFFGN